jgi:hypothetical protein
MRRRLLACAVALFVTVPRVALAEATSDGERLFEEGRRLMLDGRFDEACPKLEESQALDPHVGTLLNVAICHEKLGKVGSAWVEYQRALTAARVEGRVDRADLAKSRIAAIESRVPWLTVDRGTFEGTVTLDGANLEAAALGTAMPVDPGDHAVAAIREGTVAFETHVKLAEGERTTVRISTDTSKPPPKEAVIVEPAGRHVARALEPATPAGRKKGAWVLELGAFSGFLGGGGARGQLVDRESVLLSKPGESGATCASRTCSVGTIPNDVSATLGLTVLGGYALSDSITLGARVLAAPAIGSRSAWGLGPEVVLHPHDGFSIGLWALFGDGSQEGKAPVFAPDFSITGSPANATGTVGGGAGAGLDVSIRVFELARTSFWLQALPFFISGDRGGIYAVPLGGAVRFQ